MLRLARRAMQRLCAFAAQRGDTRGIECGARRKLSAYQRLQDKRIPAEDQKPQPPDAHPEGSRALHVRT